MAGGPERRLPLRGGETKAFIEAAPGPSPRGDCCARKRRSSMVMVFVLPVYTTQQRNRQVYIDNSDNYSK